MPMTDTREAELLTDGTGGANAPFRDGERAANGRFLLGNRGGPGNPFGKQVGALRAALLSAVTPEELAAITATLVQLAKDGNVAAIREVFDRTLGKPVESDLLERLEALESLLAALQTQAGAR